MKKKSKGIKTKLPLPAYGGESPKEVREALKDPNVTLPGRQKN